MNTEYFVGKFCSIFTSQHSRDLYRESPKDYPSVVFRYFVGKILSFDKEGIVLERVSKGLRTWVAREHLVAVAEEEVLDPKNPEDAKLIQEMERVKSERRKQPTVPTQQAFSGSTLNPKALAQLAQDVKSKFGTT